LLLEIAVFNIESALLAAGSGADRLELCENPLEGGTTPSYGTLHMVRSLVTIPVFPIIRPRGGDFLFSTSEIAVMKKDIALCKELGFEGVVIGLLNQDGTINAQVTRELVELAYPMEVTFHRAFDRVKDPLAAMETLIGIGCQRILTSGQQPNAWEGRELIRELVQASDNRICILPGSGIRSNNYQELIQFTGVTEIHSSARKINPSPMDFLVPGMQETLENTSVDVDEIRKMTSKK
jgi:copper homeostasis protein